MTPCQKLMVVAPTLTLLASATLCAAAPPAGPKGLASGRPALAAPFQHPSSRAGLRLLVSDAGGALSPVVNLTQEDARRGIVRHPLLTPEDARRMTVRTLLWTEEDRRRTVWRYAGGGADTARLVVPRSPAGAVPPRR